VGPQRPDLILMDIQLPIMDGYTATRQIKANPALRSIPIIAVTSYALSGEEKKARAAGCDDYVPKPFSPRLALAPDVANELECQLLIVLLECQIVACAGKRHTNLCLTQELHLSTTHPI
jgi:CheY-like chemotaxis protein